MFLWTFLWFRGPGSGEVFLNGTRSGWMHVNHCEYISLHPFMIYFPTFCWCSGNIPYMDAMGMWMHYVWKLQVGVLPTTNITSDLNSCKAYIYMIYKYVQKPANVAVVDHDAQRIYHQVLEIPKMKMQCLRRLVWRWKNPSTAYIAWKQHQLGPPANSQTLNTKNHVKNKVSHWILVRIL